VSGASELAYLCRAIKAPSLLASAARLAERARAEGWTHEQYLVACLDREVAARADHGGEGRIRAARFPARKTLEGFDFDHQRAARRDQLMHLGQLDFIAERTNIVLVGPPGTGKTCCSPPPPGGWRAWARPTCAAGSRPSFGAWGGTRCL